jgi:DNA invertase Pin-like site-specific DNA recombinase
MTAISVAQYLRISTEHQNYSLENQVKTISIYAQDHGFEIVQTYSDEGRSGLLLKNRPELMLLLSDVIGGHAGFRAVLVYDVSRWGRFQDSDEAAHYEFVCKSAGVPVHYCAENFVNDNTPFSSIAKALKRTMAAEYSREMGARVYAGAKRLAELGFKQGGVPGYGLRRLMISAGGEQRKILSAGELKGLRKDRVILVRGPEEEVECVREMYRLVVEENRSAYYIANELNRRGIKSPTGKWRPQTVNRILTGPKYAGYSVWNRTTCRLGSPKVRVAKSHWVLKSRAFEPVVEPQLFEQAQVALGEQRQPYSNEELLNSLRDLLMRNGKLSYEILKESPDLASMNTLIRRFGTLRHAFALAGYGNQRTMPSDEQRHIARRFRDQLFSQVMSLFPGQISIFRPGAKAPRCLHVDGTFRVSVVVCPAVRRDHGVNWFIDERLTQDTGLTLLARLKSNNTQVRDYYVLETPGFHWIRRSGELKHGKQLADLSELPAAARAIVSHQC